MHYVSAGCRRSWLCTSSYILSFSTILAAFWLFCFCHVTWSQTYQVGFFSLFLSAIFLQDVGDYGSPYLPIFLLIFHDSYFFMIHLCHFVYFPNLSSSILAPFSCFLVFNGICECWTCHCFFPHYIISTILSDSYKQFLQRPYFP